MSLKFEWDPRKAVTNLSKYGVSFQEALTAFADPLTRIFDDEDHSIREQREIIIGRSAKARLFACALRHKASQLESLVYERQRDEGEKKNFKS
jgi:uncharacterized protein